MSTFDSTSSATTSPLDEAQSSSLTFLQSWMGSMVFHLVLTIVLALVMGSIHVASTIGSAPTFDLVTQPESLEPEITHFEVGETPIDPTELTTETLSMTEAPSVEAQFNDDSPLFEEAGGGIAGGDSSFGGLGGFDVASLDLGPALKGGGGVDTGAGFGTNMGTGGAGTGFGSRGSGMREALLGSGGTKQSERAVAAALNWFARHQNANGSWSLNHTSRCRGICSGRGAMDSDTGATALALLPFLAAGQTHQSNGPYQKNIQRGITWLIQNQGQSGDLSTGQSQMYSHGLATIALCEAYGMTQDSRVGYAAQSALNFIESGQNSQGAWRYTHGSNDSDTSVLGWQLMALKSGQMAGLKVSEATFAGCKKYLQSCASGVYGSEFSYMPEYAPTDTMTAVGLLGSQYLGAKRDDPVIHGGIEFLMNHKPDVNERNTYYWYYATQVMHNVPGKEWDEWNRQMRKILVNTQEKDGCAAGSWDPIEPSPDPWGAQGGRLMVTSFCTLTLEVYYRYLPLYKLNDKDKSLQRVE